MDMSADKLSIGFLLWEPGTPETRWSLEIMRMLASYVLDEGSLEQLYQSKLARMLTIQPISSAHCSAEGCYHYLAYGEDNPSVGSRIVFTFSPGEITKWHRAYLPLPTELALLRPLGTQSFTLNVDVGLRLETPWKTYPTAPQRALFTLIIAGSSNSTDFNLTLCHATSTTCSKQITITLTPHNFLNYYGSLQEPPIYIGLTLLNGTPPEGESPMIISVWLNTTSRPPQLKTRTVWPHLSFFNTHNEYFATSLYRNTLSVAPAFGVRKMVKGQIVYSFPKEDPNSPYSVSLSVLIKSIPDYNEMAPPEDVIFNVTARYLSRRGAPGSYEGAFIRVDIWSPYIVPSSLLSVKGFTHGPGDTWPDLSKLIEGVPLVGTLISMVWEDVGHPIPFVKKLVLASFEGYEIIRKALSVAIMGGQEAGHVYVVWEKPALTENLPVSFFSIQPFEGPFWEPKDPDDRVIRCEIVASGEVDFVAKGVGMIGVWTSEPGP